MTTTTTGIVCVCGSKDFAVIRTTATRGGILRRRRCSLCGQRLTIAGTPFDDKGMAAVAEIKHLRDFRTWHTYQTAAGNESLTKLPELKSLWLGQRLRRYDGGSNAASLDDSTFDVLTKLKTLESLTLDEARLSLASLQRLKKLPRLKKLELRRIDISATDAEALRASLPAVAIDWKPLTDDERTKLEEFLKK